jgi:heme-degrading monooxygenase HmoA
MYVRVITAPYQPAKMDEGIRIFSELLPEITEQPGFKGFLGLVHPGTDKTMSTSIWESEAHAQVIGPGSAYYQVQLAKLGPLFAAIPNVESYEVALQA